MFSKHYERGYTLIEILVVIAILGLLAAIAIPNILNLINSGEAEAMEAELHNIQASVLAMMADSDTHFLNSHYQDIQTYTEAQSVLVTVEGETYNLADYILGDGAYPFKRPYDISKSGVVTPSE